MNIERRIKAFSALGKRLRHLKEDDFDNLADKAASENRWFTKQNVRMAWQSIAGMLQEDSLQQWVSPYALSDKENTVAIVMAGNIPLVGFHDFLSVLISGDSVQIKASSKDSVLIRYLADLLMEIEPDFRSRIIFTERLQNFDAIIATGSDNTSRYFEYYFKKYPHIIRKNRTSSALLTGRETEEEFKQLGVDVFSYFGLGCRNVSKLFVPTGYDFSPLLKSWETFSDLGNHHKYHNNYDYQKSIMLINLVPFLDNGFVMVTESEKTVSPISVVFYEYYANEKDLKDRISAMDDKLQCIVGKIYPATVSFGSAQHPTLQDYADNVDTLAFLNTL